MNEGQMKLIGIAGRMETGKSTLANLLIKESENGIVIPFAKQLKILATMLGWDGQKNEKGRRFLQILGTEIARERIDHYYWVNLYRRYLFYGEGFVFNQTDYFNYYKTITVQDLDTEKTQLEILEIFHEFHSNIQVDIEYLCNPPYKTHDLIVCDDIRFLNEAHFIIEHKGRMIYIKSDRGNQDSHTSEKIDLVGIPHLKIINNKNDSLLNLERQAKAILNYDRRLDSINK